MTGRAPGPMLLIGLAICALAFATDHPLVLAGTTAAALLLHFSAEHRRAIYPVVGLVIGVGIAFVNPFVQANGDLILFELPDIPIIDLQVTFEEVVASLALGLQAFSVTVAIGAVLAHADPDRLLAAAGRLAPRSALTASVAARMLPTLERDAVALVETMRLRGRSPSAGSWRARTRTAGALAIPLTGSALERSLDVAEAMAARGYGSGPATRVPRVRWTFRERVVVAAALPLLGLCVATIAGGTGGYRFYPTLASPWSLREVVTALAVAALTGVAAGAARR